MDDSTYKVVEIVGTSSAGVTEAMNAGVARASQTLEELDWLHVTDIRGHIEGDEIAHFQVAMKVGFRLRDT